MTDITIKKYLGGWRVENKNTGHRYGRLIQSEEDAKKQAKFQDISSDKYEGGEHMDYGKAYGGSLGYNPSKQPVKNAGHVDSTSPNATKLRGSVAEGVKMKQKGQPGRSYSVGVVNKAVAKMGGH